MRRDTICALCTPLGKGALSVIRVSGPKALKSVRPLASFLPSEIKTHKAYVGVLKNKKELFDQVVITYFKEGASFTGEETLEISCHGGEFIAHKVLSSLHLQGIRPAKRGEFSFQSFSNGKLDLTQAEGILQLIESKNSSAHQMAFQQLQGRLSKELVEIEKKWLFVLSHIEADIDFSLEDIQVLDDRQFKKEISFLKEKVNDLLCHYKPFEELQSGVNLGLFGPVNAGKSTLFNKLLGQEKAIVSSEEGTTRDPVEGKLFSPSGLNISLKDTAGFRKTNQAVEQKGQEKTKDILSLSTFSLFVFEWRESFQQELKELLVDNLDRVFLVFSKKDLHPQITKEKICLKIKKEAPQLFEQISAKKIFFVSAQTGEGMEELKTQILNLGKGDIEEDFFVTNQRHFNGLKQMQKSLQQASRILSAGKERDIIALELREGLLSLYEITGKQLNEQVLDKIFKQFCIGK